MILNSKQLKQLISQARRDAPNETWGMIGGKDGRALKIFPMTNSHATPQTRYVADPLELLRVVREIEDVNGWDILAIYHSHPKTEPYPSATDTGEAHYPDSIYVIISLQNPDQAKMRGYRIVEGKVSEITIEIEDGDESGKAARELNKRPRKVKGKRDEKSKRAHPRRAPRRASRPRPRRAVAALSKRRPARRNARRPRRRLSK